MIHKNCVGLIKFFRNEQFLDDLRDGLFYCNTPEFYRNSKDEGISDLNESCIYSYRKERDKIPPEIIIDGVRLNEASLNASTLKKGGQTDKWLHCWFELSFVQNAEYMQDLIEDISRIRKEFGNQYVLLLLNDIPELKRRLAKTTHLKIKEGKVKYSEEKLDWGYACKSENYAYQREFRFLFGECDDAEIRPLKLRYNDGFKDIIHKNNEIKLVDNNSKKTRFFLSKDECFGDPNTFDID
jgi:hypothetical protein